VRAQLRIEAAFEQLARLSREIEQALVELTAVDRIRDEYVGHYKSPLAALNATLRGAVVELNASLQRLQSQVGRSVGTLYEDLRDHDQAIVWLRRVWQFYADKLDQRRWTMPAVDRALLQSADEVVWGCYQPVFKHLGSAAAARRPPAPIAFIASEYSPAALEAHKPVPLDLQLDAEIEGVDALLRRLPAPLLRLPQWYCNSPWWLVHIGHEVGHYVQHDLKLMKSVGEKLRAAAMAAGSTEASAQRWERWSDEVFADAFAVHTMGPWSLLAIAEVEWAERDRMLTSSARYPPPAVRLALMRQVARDLELEVTADLLPGDLDAVLASDTAAVRDDMNAVPAISLCLVGSIDARDRTLAELCSFKPGEFSANGTIARWAETLAHENKPFPPSDRSAQTPRLIAAGALRAWCDLAQQSDPSRRARAAQTIARRTLEVLPGSGPPGTREAQRHEAPLPGSELVRHLLARSKERRLVASVSHDFWH
jgi:hypothetical protein